MLRDGLVDLRLGEGVGAIHWGHEGRRGGGVGIFYRTSRIKAIGITPKENPHEICSALCSLRGTLRKILCIGVYLSTALDVPSAEEYLEYLSDLIHHFKSKYKDLHIVVAGDWNRADTSIALEDFPSLTAVPTPPTCEDDILDIVY